MFATTRMKNSQQLKDQYHTDYDLLVRDVILSLVGVIPKLFGIIVILAEIVCCEHKPGRKFKGPSHTQRSNVDFFLQLFCLSRLQLGCRDFKITRNICQGHPKLSKVKTSYNYVCTGCNDLGWKDFKITKHRY